MHWERICILLSGGCNSPGIQGEIRENIISQRQEKLWININIREYICWTLIFSSTVIVNIACGYTMGKTTGQQMRKFFSMF